MADVGKNAMDPAVALTQEADSLTANTVVRPHVTAAAAATVASRPVASILLPTKNSAEFLEPLLKGVFSQVAPFEFEMVVVDSGSKDETLEILSRYPVRVYRIPPEDFNHGGTRNYLASLAKGDFFVFLSHDAVPAHPQWLENLVAPIMNEGMAGAYARQVPRPMTDAINRFFLGEMYPAESRVQALDGGSLKLETVRFSDASSAMRRDVWSQIPFRDDIIMAEDQDWSVRVLKAGFSIKYAANAVVEHAHEYTLGETFKKYFDSGVSYLDIFQQVDKGEHRFSSQFLKSGVQHVARKVRFLKQSGEGKQIFRALTVSGTKALAVFLGRHHKAIPRGAKMKMSWHKYHWDPKRVLASTKAVRAVVIQNGVARVHSPVELLKATQ